MKIISFVSNEDMVSLDNKHFFYSYKFLDGGFTRLGICNCKGKLVTKERYIQIIKFDNINVLLVKKDNENYSIVKLYITNILIDNKEYTDYKECDNYLILSSKKSSKTIFTILDKDGNIIFNEECDDLEYLNEDMFLINKDNYLYGFNVLENKRFKLLNILEKPKIKRGINGKKFNYDCFIKPYSCGFALKEYLNDYFVYIDKSGNERFNFGTHLKDITNFYNPINSDIYIGVFKRFNSDYRAVIDNNGNLLFEVGPDKEIIQTKFDVFIIKDNFNHVYGVVDIHGSTIIPTMYHYINIAKNGICFCDDGFKRDYYTLSGKKLDIDDTLDYIDALDDREVIVVENENTDDPNCFSYMNSEKKIMFNGLTFSDKYYNYNKNDRIIESRHEISYEMNDCYEYTRFYVLDLRKNEIVFTYPRDKEFDDIEYLYTENHNFYIAKLHEENRYAVMNYNGVIISKLYSEERPVIKNGFILTKVSGFYQIFCNINNVIINVLEKDFEDGRVDYIDVLNSNALFIKNDDRKYLFMVDALYDYESMQLTVEKYDITEFNKGKSLRKLFKW